MYYVMAVSFFLGGWRRSKQKIGRAKEIAEHKHLQIEFTIFFVPLVVKVVLSDCSIELVIWVQRIAKSNVKLLLPIFVTTSHLLC